MLTSDNSFRIATYSAFSAVDFACTAKRKVHALAYSQLLVITMLDIDEK